MTQDVQISFFGCCKAEPGITVRGTGHPRYRYIESAARSLTRWITVKAGTVVRRFVRFVVPFFALPSISRRQMFAFVGELRL